MMSGKYTVVTHCPLTCALGGLKVKLQRNGITATKSSADLTGLECLRLVSLVKIKGNNYSTIKITQNSGIKS